MSRTERHNWRGTVRDGGPGICPDGANCEICGKAAIRRANRRDRHQARADIRREPVDAGAEEPFGVLCVLWGHDFDGGRCTRCGIRSYQVEERCPVPVTDDNRISYTTKEDS